MKNLLQDNAIYREIYESQTESGGDFDQRRLMDKEATDMMARQTEKRRKASCSGP